MRKNISKIIIFTIFINAQGCASALFLNDTRPKNIIPNIQKTECATEKRKIIWTQISMGQLSSKDSESKLTQYELEQKKNIMSQLDKYFVRSCTMHTKVFVEISNVPINESRGLFLLNTISLGIIPYWDNYENKIKIDIYDDENHIKSLESTFSYRRVQSIFLWPAAPFVITSDHDLNLTTIPMHFDNIFNENSMKENLK